VFAPRLQKGWTYQNAGDDGFDREWMCFMKKTISRRPPAGAPDDTVVNQRMGKSAYTIGFAAYTGEVGNPFTEPRSLPPAPAG
jgi:hypothetical protein